MTKHRGLLGPLPEDTREITILNRIWTYNMVPGAGGVLQPLVTLEADPRHVSLMSSMVGLKEDSKSKTVTGSKQANKIVDDRPLVGEKLTLFRSIVMRGLYLSEDYPTIRFAVKELSRCMSAPTEDRWCNLKELCRFLVGAPRLVQHFPWQEKQAELHMKVGSDHAGCLRTRRSTSGGSALHGVHCVKHYSSTQTVIAISSGESEFYSIVRGSSVGLGLISLAKDLLVDLKLCVYTDAVAGKGIAMRRGLGKVRHLNAQYLWVQDLFSRGKAQCRKIAGKDNPGDLFTKYLGAAEAWKFTNMLGYYKCSGESKLALKTTG